jgi:hypothetical protein
MTSLISLIFVLRSDLQVNSAYTKGVRSSMKKTSGHPSRSRLNPASSSTFTPNLRALSSLDPGSAPATR